MKKNAFAIALATTAMMIFSTVAFAGPFGHGHGHGKRHHGGHGLLRQLDLTDAQKEQIRAIKESYRPQMETYREQMMNARMAAGDAIHAATFDEAAVRSAVQSAAKIKEEMAVLRAKGYQEVRAVLTAEQIQKFDELRKERMERIQERMDERFGDDEDI